MNCRFFVLGFVFSSLFFSGLSQPNDNIYKYKVGDCEVILLSEGQQKGNTDILIGATEKMKSIYVPDGSFPNAVNAFLVKTPDSNVLVDAGLGNKLKSNLESIGILPTDIDYIYLTHMHGDHIGGLLENGEKAFPNAHIFISPKEAQYWNSDIEMDKVPENKRGGFAGARKVIQKYADKISLLPPSAVDGETNTLFTTIEAYGHTPGHVGLMISSAGQKMLIWGDLTHAMDIQMPHPEVAVTYDIDPEEAIKSRKNILRYVYQNKIPVAGMHIAYPAMGTVQRNMYGGYEFITVEEKESE